MDNVKLQIVGDIMIESKQINYIKDNSDYTDDNEFLFGKCFRYIKNYLKDNDYLIGNLETPITNKLSSYPFFSANKEFLKAISNLGFNMFITSNNHCLDQGYKGFNQTLDNIDELNIDHIGTYRNIQEKKDNYPFIKTINNIKIGFLSYTYIPKSLNKEKRCVFGISGQFDKNAKEIINFYNKEQFDIDIKKLKSKQPDVIITFMHWGPNAELSFNYDKEQQYDIAQYLINNDVDVIVGGHPHFPQKTEWMYDKNNKKHLVIFSLGSFISTMHTVFINSGKILNLNITKTYNNIDISFNEKLIFTSDNNMNNINNYTELHNIYVKKINYNKTNILTPNERQKTIWLEKNLL